MLYKDLFNVHFGYYFAALKLEHWLFRIVIARETSPHPLSSIPSTWMPISFEILFLFSP